MRVVRAVLDADDTPPLIDELARLANAAKQQRAGNTTDTV
jgi:hypothetical protein